MRGAIGAGDKQQQQNVAAYTFQTMQNQERKVDF